MDKSCVSDSLEERVKRIEKWMDRYAIFVEELYHTLEDHTKDEEDS